MGIAKSLRGATAAAAAALLLAACASPASIQPGEPLGSVTQRLGRPTLEMPRPDGGTRLIWSTQPMGQFVWVTDVDASGKTISNQQALTTENFDRIKIGEWDTERLRYEFGPPAEISRVGLRGEHLVWSYRYRQDGVWNSLMHIYISDSGKVERFHPGPDPLAEPRDGMFMF
ncbi:lipoprotein [Pigmentiphaga soli]|uniref:Lipoprotein n=1 Tax=Pigmentiphaga soli TaxID=1007095 RepID=A0ABP8GQM0_9BURK